jgi:hypothetical protein
MGKHWSKQKMYIFTKVYRVDKNQVRSNNPLITQLTAYHVITINTISIEKLHIDPKQECLIGNYAHMWALTSTITDS